MDDPNFFEMEEEYDSPDDDDDEGDLPEDHDPDDSPEDPDYQPHPCDYESDSDAEGKDVAEKLSRKEKKELIDTPFPKPGDTYHPKHLPLLELMLKSLKKMQAAHKQQFGRENPPPDTIERALDSGVGHEIENDNLYYGTGTQHPF
jgi:hypothetical protein